MVQLPSRQRPHGAPMAADPSRAASPVQRLGAAGCDWLFDRVDPLGGADHRRRLVEQAAGFHVLEQERFDFQLMPPLVRPHVLGVAQRPASHPSAQQAEGESTMNVLVNGAT
jgi:hypothetical protein